MKQHEDNARAGDLFTTADRPYGDDVDAEDDATAMSLIWWPGAGC